MNESSPPAEDRGTIRRSGDESDESVTKNNPGKFRADINRRTVPGWSVQVHLSEKEQVGPCPTPSLLTFSF